MGSVQVENKITNKWRETGLLEGLSDAQQATVAQGLENQAGWMLHSKMQNLDLLMPLARAVMLKVLDNLVTVNLPAFVIQHHDYEGHTDPAVVAVWRYGVGIEAKDLKNPTPALVERLASDMAQSILLQKGANSKIYLYMPVLLLQQSNSYYSLAYRATFR